MPPKKNKKATASAAPTASTTSMPKPSWPPLKPLVPAADLALETVLADQIVIARKLFTATLCQRYVSYLASLPLATTPGIPKRGEALRVNDRFEIQDADFAERLWRETALRELVEAEGKGTWGGEVVGLNPRVRIYRYKSGQFFDKHCELSCYTRTELHADGEPDDDYNLVALPTEPPTPARTTWTLLIYLTGPSTGCAGGETVFYPDERGAELIAVAPEPGLALLHKHGNDCLLHEGRAVTAGEKWVIRSDLCVKR